MNDDDSITVDYRYWTGDFDVNATAIDTYYETPKIRYFNCKRCGAAGQSVKCEYCGSAEGE